jgi:hypothetical protein
LSARKRYILTKVLTRAGAHFEEADATADVPEAEKPTEKPETKAKPAKEPKAAAKTTDAKEEKA